MEDNELTAAWSDLKVTAGRPPTEMPLASVSLAGLTFSTVCLHNADHWLNLILQGRGWRIQGFVAQPYLDDDRPFRLYWARSRRWVEAESPSHLWGDSPGSSDVEWLAHELASELPLAIANKLAAMT